MRGLSRTRLLFCVVFLPVIYLSASQQNSATQATSAPLPKNTIFVTVTDHDHRPVTGLKPEDFTIYVDNTGVPVGEFAPADAPACIGILVDESGSMRHKLAAITSAVTEFVRSGNPANQVFLVFFNDDPYLDQDFTTDPAKIEQALKRADARGGTAFYDSLIATADHLAENKACNKRVVLALTDGYDNESRKTREFTFHSLQESGTPLIYSIGVSGNNAMSAPGRQTLEFLAKMSGAAAFFADSSGDIRKAAHKVLEELGSQYRISYESSATPSSNVKVMVHASDHKDLAVRVNNATPITHVATTVAARAAAGNLPSSSPAGAAVSASPTAPLGPDCISGTVLDEDQTPLARIRVEAMPAFGPNPYAGRLPYSVTDMRGHFALTGLAKGNYRLFERPDPYPRGQGVFYRNEDRTPIASSESCANVTVKFLTRFATLKVHVIDAVTHEPIPDYAVTLRNSLGEAFSISRFDREAGIRVPPRMALTVQAWVAGQHHMSDPITVTTPADGISQEITVELDQRATTTVKNP
jgi:VWFA-related protein